MSVTDSIPAIDVQHLNVSLEKTPILHDVTFTIQQGEYAAIIGPNGAGKTTLLKAILGLIPIDSGSISILGTLQQAFHEKYVLGYIPQRATSSVTKFPATVTEVVRSGRTARLGLWSRFSHEDEKKVTTALQRTDLLKLRNRSISELSGGELQRVFIARALAGEPKILVLDEPTVGVDLSAQESFYRFLQELNSELDLTILIVTHEVDVAVHRAKFVICLNRKLICHIPSSHLLKSDYLEELYGHHVHHVHHTHYNEQ